MNEGDLSNGAFREGASPLTTGVGDGAFREGAPPLTAGINRSGPMVRRSAAITILLVGIAVLLFLAWFGTMHYLVPGFEREFAQRLEAKRPFRPMLLIDDNRLHTVGSRYFINGG